MEKIFENISERNKKIDKDSFLKAKMFMRKCFRNKVMDKGAKVIDDETSEKLKK